MLFYMHRKGNGSVRIQIHFIYRRLHVVKRNFISFVLIQNKTSNTSQESIKLDYLHTRLLHLYSHMPNISAADPEYPFRKEGGGVICVLLHVLCSSDFST